MNDVLVRMETTARTQALEQIQQVLPKLEDLGMSPHISTELRLAGKLLQEKGVVAILRECLPGLNKHLSNLEEVAQGAGDSHMLKDFLKHARQELQRLQQ